jgi:cytochrome P450
MVFLDLMGLPQTDRVRLQKMVDAIFHPGAGITTDIDEISRIQNEGGQKIYDYFTDVIAERRQNPRQDVVGGFVEAEIDGRPLTTEEMLDMCFTLLVGIFRRSTEDQEVLGCPVREGQVVIASLGAANVDPEVFPDGMTVDFDRKPNRHIAFGAGIHRCLGSHLARRELNVALQEWHRRIPNWSLKPGTNLSSSMPIRMVDNLELIW